MFNDGAFDAVRAKGQREINQIRLEHGEPIRFGAEGERGVVRGPAAGWSSRTWPTWGRTRCSCTTPTAATPSLAFELAHLAERPTGPTPVGVFRDIERPVYGEQFAEELETNRAEVGMDDLRALLHSGGTWTVS